MSKPEGPKRLLSKEELDALREERDQLVGEAEDRYTKVMRAFVAYQSGFPEMAPEFQVLRKKKKQFEQGEVYSSGEIERLLEEQKIDIFHRTVAEMKELEVLLDPEEARRIRKKVTDEINTELRARGAQPRLRS